MANPKRFLAATTFKPIQRVVHGDRQVTKGVVIHDIEGSARSALSWFNNPAAGGVGAHAVFSTVGEVWQLCQLQRRCYHAVKANATTIGFEHAGYSSWSRARWLTHGAVMLKKSANRTAWVCYHYGLGTPTRHVNIWAHSDGGAAWGNHGDPGRGFPWDLYIKWARSAYANLKRSHGKHW